MEKTNCWADILILLRGGTNAGKLASESILDAVQMDDMPNLMHELCTDFLLASEWSTRMNAALVIRLVSEKFSALLIPLLSDSLSDGDLLHLSDLQVDKIDQCGCGAELLGGKSTFIRDSGGDRLYGKGWLRRQQRALRKRLGLESRSSSSSHNGSSSYSSDVADALAFDRPETVLSLLGYEDVVTTNTIGRTG